MKFGPVLDLALGPTTEREPPKRWRNKWRANVNLHIYCKCAHSPQIVRPDQVFHACCVWPSYDMAETVAKERMETELRQFGYPLAEWINAYPDPD